MNRLKTLLRKPRRRHMRSREAKQHARFARYTALERRITFARQHPRLWKTYRMWVQLGRRMYWAKLALAVLLGALWWILEATPLR